MVGASTLRVLHVIPSLDPGNGGLPKAAVSLAAAQAVMGIKSTIAFLCDGGVCNDALDAFYGSIPGFGQVELRRIACRDRLGLWERRAIRRLIKGLPAGIVHIHGLWEPFLAHAQAEAHRVGVPVVVCAHGMLHPWMARRKRIAKALLVRGLGWRRLWARAAFGHALCAEEAPLLSAAGFRRVEVVPNGIFAEEDLFRDDPELPGVDAQPFLLFFSRLHEQKAPDNLLEAFTRIAPLFPSLRLVFAGPDQGCQDRLQEKAMSRGLASRVLFPGVLRGVEKWTVLHQCALFCLPSHAEGSSLALLEAALAGAPIVMSPGCQFAALAEAGGGRLCPNDPDELARAIEPLLRDPQAAARMGRRAREYVRREHRWQQSAQRLADLYRELPGT